MKKLWYKHGKHIWFGWKIGKLSMSYMGHAHPIEVRYWFELCWNGIAIMKIGRYI